ncbi:DNA polymerase [Fusobacterium varium]|uniref:DNA-directed DNA polymerase n=1 Tax=Fusobacterium varium ATCC 27725 TaxID=469618 RepID=A0ABN5JEV4_FUSVA|nr:DNA polymerase [Fusobacterium varium]AVQ30353.1 DNA polymerase I [Fusobacterium varium ATCC 27725]EES64611.1 putative DNA-directed DNA polymerase [Fusobacterium varium ATCC 27725]VEH37683.1 DNA polymerase I, thermostable [Fusobacterium varium]
MKHLSIDIETYSSVDIKKAGMYKYALSDDFQILLFAYSIDFGEVKIIDLAKGEILPEVIIEALNDKNIIKHAYNAPFEWWCLNQAGYKTSIEQWRDTMFHGLYCGYTAGLGATGAAIGLPQDKKKDTTGKALIKLFCVPCKPTKKNGGRLRNLPHHEPEKWELFKNYCIQDVVTETEIYKRLSNFPVPQEEQELWVLDQKINAYGVKIDTELVKGALSINDIVTAELTEEAIQVTGLDNPNSAAQLGKWLKEKTGQDIENLQKGTVSELIGSLEDKEAVRVLEIRQELAKTSIKKYVAMEEAICPDGRIRGLLQFYGANRTGRWAGRLVQVQNLPRNYLETLDYAREIVKSQDADFLKLVYGNVSDTLSQLIRTAFVPSEGHKFVVADFSAIEARVIAWLAGEQWRQEVFATHGKIYEASASQMFGVPIELIKKGNPEYALRQKGKVAELALGYGGSSGALIAMGALDMGLEEKELPDVVRRWRNANKRITDLWYGIENAVIKLMETGETQGLKGIIFSREIDLIYDQDFLTIKLPSGRKLYYPKPHLKENRFGSNALHYFGVNQTTKKWEVQETYGGKLVENIVQAISRDCLAVTLKRLETEGLQTVMHIHDEAVIDADPNVDLNKVCELMGQPIEWAPGLLLKAAGFESGYYMKD